MKTYLRYAKWLALPAAILLPLGAAEPGITSQQADEIINELRQIRQLLEKQAAAQPQPGGEQITKAHISTEGAYAIGLPNAPLTMVEFTDFQCPFCYGFYRDTFASIKKNYIDTGKLRFVSRDMPLDFHPNAMQAANAGRCAGEQGKFWELRDRMNANPEKLDLNNLVSFAQDVKLNVDTFRSCVESQKYRSAIENDIQTLMQIAAKLPPGESLGTPAFVIGKTTPNGVDGELVIGAMPYAAFDQKLQQLAR
jgi:protein-disulfide isomerase